ncbi:MAG: tetratricopeptide repeat protein [Acidobacteriota bacterium]|nr:tetratricopeptide repeat protein [Acidobacteriota bacterium]
MRRRGLPLLLLLCTAFALKAALLAHFDAHPLLQPAGDMDSGVYARLAWDVAHGDVLLRGPGPVPYFVSPLYIYFLAAVHALSAGSLFAAKVVQIALGTAAVGLVLLTARRLFGERAALPAGILFALTGVVSFHEILILQAALDPFLTALAMFLLADALTQGSISSKVNGAVGAGRWLAAGGAFGLLALNRPNALLCVAAVAAALLLFTFEENLLRRVGVATAFLAGAALTIAPVTLRNLAVSHEFVLISSHGGLNFLVGNGPGANGVYRALPGITPDIAGQAADTKRVAEAAEGRALSTREVSSHFARQAWDWIERNPADATRLFLRKIHLLLSGDEAPLNFSFPWYREKSLVLRLLCVGPGLLVPLAGAGFFLALFASAGAARRTLLVWSVFVPSYVFAVALFFVATRYRLPLLVALAPLAGAAVAQLPEALRAKSARLGIAAAAAAVLAAVSLRPTGLWDGAEDEDMHWALYLVEKGEAAEAARVAEAAASRHPDPGLMWFRMGQAWAAAKRMDDAIAALERARALDPHPPATEPALAAAHESRGVDRILGNDALAALPDFEAAVALSPDDAGMLLNLAAVLAEKGDRVRARDLARKSLALRPGYGKAEALLRALPK